jgi:hypothetical protein
MVGNPETGLWEVKNGILREWSANPTLPDYGSFAVMRSQRENRCLSKGVAFALR